MGIVPNHLRPAIEGELTALVRGERPEVMTWVRQYGRAGAHLVPQPDAIWTHPRTEATRRSNGGWHVVVPLWTEDESPSDLSAEAVVTRDGTTHLVDVHVL